MDVFYGILLVLAGVFMFLGLFWLIRSENVDSVRVLTFIIAALLMVVIFALYVGIMLALIVYGVLLIYHGL